MSISRLIRISAVCSVLLAAPYCFSEDTVPGDRSIYVIHSYATFAVVRFDPPYTNTEGCAGGVLAQQAGVIDLRIPGAENLLVTLLLAKAMKHKVGFGINGCFSEWGPVPVIYRVDLPQSP